jgi:hypothetical protein
VKSIDHSREGHATNDRRFMGISIEWDKLNHLPVGIQPRKGPMNAQGFSKNISGIPPIPRA